MLKTLRCFKTLFNTSKSDIHIKTFNVIQDTPMAMLKKWNSHKGLDLFYLDI